MPKSLLYVLIAAADLLLGVFMFRSGRIAVPLILAIAALCFIIAAIRETRAGGPKMGQ
jgi:hypothetical protein